MRSLLRLLVQHVVVGVTDQRSVVGVEEHLVRYLERAEIHSHRCVQVKATMLTASFRGQMLSLRCLCVSF